MNYQIPSKNGMSCCDGCAQGGPCFKNLYKNKNLQVQASCKYCGSSEADCKCGAFGVVEAFKKTVRGDIEAIKSRNQYNPYEVYDTQINLFRAMINPELHKHVRFYAPFIVPTYVFQQKTSFSINLNANVSLKFNVRDALGLKLIWDNSWTLRNLGVAQL